MNSLGGKMKRKAGLIIIFLFIPIAAQTENLTLYTGTTSVGTQIAGASVGGDIWDFLQAQLDFFKYLNEDPDLFSEFPENNRGDFMGASINFTLKIPIHLFPYMDKFDFIKPYVLVGYGYGLENLKSEYLNVPDKNGKSGIFSKLRQYDSIGFGLIVMISSTVGVKADYRTINISEHQGMSFPKRSLNRFSVGFCFGGKKEGGKTLRTRREQT